MAVQANVTNNQISASVSETKIDVAVSGGVGPTGSPGPQGPAGAAAVSSVQGRTGTVVVTITDLTAASAVHTHSTTDVVSFAAAAAAASPVQSVAGRTGTVSLAAADVSGLASVAVSGSYTSLANVPTAFAPATHTHAISEVSGLQTSLDGKASAASTNVSRVETLNGLTGTLSIVAGANVTVSTAGSAITIAAGGGGGGAVASVNGQTGTVLLTAADVTAASTSHAASHQPGGSDQLFDQSLNTSSTVAFSQITLNAPSNGEVIRINGTSGGGSDVGFAVYNQNGNQANSFYFNSKNEYVGIGVNSGEGYIQASVPLVLPTIKNEVAIRDSANSKVGTLNANNSLTADRTYTMPDANGTIVVSTSSPSSGQSLVWDGSAWAAGSVGGAVASVNGKTGTVTLTTTDLTAAAATHTHSTTDIVAFTASVASASPVQSVNGSTGVVSLSAASVTAASTSHATTHQAGGSDEILPLVTAVSLTASVNNYSLPTGNVLRLSHSGSASVAITGFGTQASGSLRLLLNVSTSTAASYTIRHENTNSTAVSRVIVPWAGDYVVSPNGGAALLLYDGTDSRWRVV